jgi:hypothetical protein
MKGERKKKFIIVSGRVTRGGTLVLGLLCKLLNEKGFNARMFYLNSVPHKDTHWRKWWFRQIRSYIKLPIIRILCALNKKTQKVQFSIWRELLYQPIKRLPVKFLPLFNKENTIVIYPEIIYGNFLKAKHVIRYLLSYNKLYTLEDKDSFGEKDLFVTYRNIFNDPILNPDNNIVHLFWFDDKLYHQYNYTERTGNCYLIRKGRNRTDLPSTFDGPVIDTGMPEEDVVRIFNEAKFCYIYDTQTFYAIIASVCGCIPIIVMEPGRTITDYLSRDEAHYGIAYGMNTEQIQYAIDTRDKLLNSLDYRESNERAINTFISLINHYFL